MSLRRVSFALVLLAVAGFGIWVYRLASSPIVLPAVGEREQELPDPGPPPVTVDLLTLAAHHEEYQGKQVIVTGWLVGKEGAYMQAGPWKVAVSWLLFAKNVSAVHPLFRDGEPIYATLQGRFSDEGAVQSGHRNPFKLVVSNVLSVDPSRPKPMPVDAGYPSPIESKTR